MRFYNIDKKLPQEGQWCLIKEKIRNRKDVHVSIWPQHYYEHCGFMCHPDVIGWSPMPEHICHNNKGWKSEFRGDELPSKSCWCVVCADKNEIVSCAYFDAPKQRFLGYPNVVAFMSI